MPITPATRESLKTLYNALADRILKPDDPVKGRFASSWTAGKHSRRSRKNSRKSPPELKASRSNASGLKIFRHSEYVKELNSKGASGADPIEEIATEIDWGQGGGVCLFTGQRGATLTNSSLMRLTASVEGLSIRRQIVERLGSTPGPLRDLSISLNLVRKVAQAQGDWSQAHRSRKHL
jgi:hypothetical protein